MNNMNDFSTAEVYPNGKPTEEGMSLAQVQSFTKVQAPSLESGLVEEGEGMGFGLDVSADIPGTEA